MWTQDSNLPSTGGVVGNVDHAVNVSSLSSKKKKSEKQIGEAEVQSIEDERVVGGHHPYRQYRIRWKGYDSTADTWEPLKNLKNCLRN